MASTITLTGDWLVNIGNRNMTMGTGNLGTYAADGIAVTAKQVGLGTIDELVCDPAGGYVFSYNKTTGKVLAYEQTDPADAGGANVPLVEVTASTDLASITFRFRAIGR